MGTRDGKVVRLPLDLPLHFRRRVASITTRLVGLENIAAACNMTPDKIVRLHNEARFPLVWKGGKWKGQWTTTSEAIERWLRSLPKRDPRRQEQAQRSGSR
ncbi:MAG: hypothetical protein HY574_09515 [candidate division NC10 bacterium]|nr:hypothetical protein [candidate division NC10 bacterium]